MLSLVLLAALAVPPPPEPPLLRVGMDTRSRPWAFVPGLEYSDEDYLQAPRVTAAQLETIVGVDIDVLEALASRLGVKTRIVPTAWQSVEKGLVDKKYDIVVNAWVPNSRTPPGIVATSAYNEWGLLVVVRSGDTGLRSFADLAGKVVGHFEDASVDRSVISLRPGKRVPFDDSDALFDALAAGKLDAAVEDSFYSRWRVAHDPRFRIVGEPLNRVGYHIAVRREDKELLARLEAAIKDLRGSGELARIRKRWEGPDTPAR